MTDPNDYIPDLTERYPSDREEEPEKVDDADEWGDRKREEDEA